MKKTLLAIATAASFMLGGAAHAEDKLKIGFIYIGPPGDFGWTYQHDVARMPNARLSVWRVQAIS